MIKKIITIATLLFLAIHANLLANSFYQHEIYVYCGNNEQAYEHIKNKLENYNIAPIVVNKLDKTSKKLHLIFDAQYIPFEYFPENYIVYQTLDFDETPLTKSYVEKLEKAIAIWDPSYKNINKYSLCLEHYYRFDEKYIDPLIMPFLIPTDALSSYKELLRYSNAKDTDISSHLPVIFTHCVLQQPKVVIELGVRSGESSRAFKKALERCDARIIGIDIDSKSANVYTKLSVKNSEFKNMDDLLFPAWKDNNGYRDMKADIIFIDTSHYYDHTVKELEAYVPLLEKNGLFIFHDTNMCPLIKCTYQRINNTYGIGWDNKKGVVRAIKDFFAISFDEAIYTAVTFESKGSQWSLLHYPHCNGLTLIKKLS